MNLKTLLLSINQIFTYFLALIYYKYSLIKYAIINFYGIVLTFYHNFNKEFITEQVPFLFGYIMYFWVFGLCVLHLVLFWINVILFGLLLIFSLFLFFYLLFILIIFLKLSIKSLKLIIYLLKRVNAYFIQFYIYYGLIALIYGYFTYLALHVSFWFFVNWWFSLYILFRLLVPYYIYVEVDERDEEHKEDNQY